MRPPRSGLFVIPSMSAASRTCSVTQHSPQRSNTTLWPNPVWRDGHWLERLRTWRLLQLECDPLFFPIDFLLAALTSNFVLTGDLASCFNIPIALIAYKKLNQFFDICQGHIN